MSSNLSPKEKLRALGLKFASSQENPLADEFDELKAQIDSELSNGFSEFQSDVNNQSSYSEFENYLTGTLSVSSDTASTLRNKFESFYSSFSDFQTELNSFSSFAAWEGSFTWGNTVGGSEETSDGKQVNGIRFFDSPGVTKAGEQVPAGTVEVFGPRIEFSETSAPADSNPDKSSVLSYSNMNVTPSSPAIGEQFTAQADVTNNGNTTERVTPSLIIDGDVKKTGNSFDIDPGTTFTFGINYILYDAGNYEVKLNKASAVTVTVGP